ncbi:unnamed protein product [Urochloa decumbens]|uniref:Strictosidine synthase conserved region domain-containing protein n=1 Tax=Urochloa decumbens TaxID=240449 RepID=A0ABC8ZCG5_9POAL
MSRMSILVLLVASLLLSSSSPAHADQQAAKPWSIHDPKPAGGVAQSLALKQINLPDGVTGAESLAFDRRGQGPYAGFHARTGDLYIADAYLGLMKVGPGGGEATVLVAEADDGVPFAFVNGVDVDQATGDVYFTDSSTTYTRAHNTEILLHRDSSGRLLSADRSHVVVAHTGPCQAFRYWLKGPKAGSYELFADLPGYADNVRRDAKGGYWFALNRESVNATAPEHLVGVRVDGKGVGHEVVTAPEGVTLSDIAEKDGNLWLGSVELDYVGRVNYKSVSK